MSGLNEAEVQRMVHEAEAHAEEDRRRRELVDLRNQADAAIYGAEKALKDAEGRLPADVKGDIDGAISALRAVMQRDQAQPIRDGIERLRQASMRVGEASARAGQGSGGPITITLYVNGSASPLTVTGDSSGNAPPTVSDTAHTQTISAGQTWALYASGSGLTTGVEILNISVHCQ